MSIFGITKGYSLFPVEHLMIYTVRGPHRRPIIDFPTRHYYSVLKAVGVVPQYLAGKSDYEIYVQKHIQPGLNKAKSL